MSELKATRIKMIYNGEIYEDFGTVPCTQLYYRKAEADKVIAHHKRKRCLALARIANDDFHLSNQFYQMGRKEFEKKKCERYSRHHFKWLAIADKFKEEAK